MNVEQPSLFDPPGSRKAREEAIARVGDHAHTEFIYRALQSVLAVAQRRRELTTDDVVAYMAEWFPGVTTHEPRAWGAVMREAAREGWVVNTKRTRESNMVSNHRRPKTVWRSNLDQQVQA